MCSALKASFSREEAVCRFATAVPARPIETGQVGMRDERLEHLELLGGALAERGFAVRTVTPAEGPPYLRVSNPVAPALTDRVMCERDKAGEWWFWWPWAQRITLVHQLDDAVGQVARVLASIDE